MSKKTLGMRVLEGQDVAYDVIEFPQEVHDGLGVAEHAGLPPEMVYKTLVVEASEYGFKPMLVMVASHRMLDLKQFARAIGAKKVRMARHDDAEDMTGLKVGGISPLALLNQGFDIYLDKPALEQGQIAISAGERGLNVLLDINDLIHVTGAKVIEAS